MKKLINYSDDTIVNDLKKEIKQNFKKGSGITPSFIQRRYSVGYNKTARILNILVEDKIIKFNTDRTKAPIIL